MKKDNRLRKAINNVINKLERSSFINNHKSTDKDFTRESVLNFVVVFMLILKKTIKSLQLVLNELFINGDIKRTVSSSAYTQARKKFKHTAFIELNDDTINIYYQDDDIRRWRNYRCLGVDGSKIILPNTKAIREEFGEIKIKNQNMEGIYTSGMFVCYYDVLNKIAVKSILGSALSYEVDLAGKLLEEEGIWANDLMIFDRGYASYEFLAFLHKKAKNYVIRIPKNSFKVTQSLFEGKGNWSKVVKLTAPKEKRKDIEAGGLPTEIKVRFASVILSTGEIEVLVTSLMDEKISREEFKTLYGLRWNTEVFFNLIKGRLCLENFTGKTVESIKQDFWSTIFISNIETVLTEETEKEINIDLKEDQLNKRVNHAVSFNAIKNMSFDIFFNDKDSDSSIKKLISIFKTGTFVERKDRCSPRKKSSMRRSYNFLRRIKKYVF
jgi:hypothetical protein